MIEKIYNYMLYACISPISNSAVLMMATNNSQHIASKFLFNNKNNNKIKAINIQQAEVGFYLFIFDAVTTFEGFRWRCNRKRHLFTSSCATLVMSISDFQFKEAYFFKK